MLTFPKKETRDDEAVLENEFTTFCQAMKRVSEKK